MQSVSFFSIKSTEEQLPAEFTMKQTLLKGLTFYSGSREWVEALIDGLKHCANIEKLE